MKVITQTFPSVFETSFGFVENSAKDQLHGIKVKKDNTWYIVGDLAKKNGISAARITNASPTEEDFDILFRSALVNLSGKLTAPVTITLGFPFSTYNAFKAAAQQYLSKRHFLVESDSQTFNVSGKIKKETFDIERYEIIPEIVGGIIALKKIYEQDMPDNFLALSFGFGTLEGIMASKDGLINRTSFSTHGIQYAINNLSRELNKKHYLELKNEHQLDDIFMKGSFFANRKRVDIAELKEELLSQYYREIVSPMIRRHITEGDLESCGKIYLMGGGAHYFTLINAVKDEFESFIPVEVVDEPEKLVSAGYLYNSLRLSDNYPGRCAGIDIGNAYTMVSTFSDSNNSLSEFKI